VQTRSPDRPAWGVDDAAFDPHLQSAHFKQWTMDAQNAGWVASKTVRRLRRVAP
jgi:quinol monooxygenase YgiN